MLSKVYEIVKSLKSLYYTEGGGYLWIKIYQMRISSQVPKFSDRWIPYLSGTFLAVFTVTEVSIAALSETTKNNMRNYVGLSFLILFLYLFFRTDRRIAKSYWLPIALLTILCAILYCILPFRPPVA
jgi:hypothetical protein